MSKEIQTPAQMVTLRQKKEIDNLQALEKKFFYEWMKRQPLLAVDLGLHEFATELPDGTIDAELRNINFLKKYLAEFRKIRSDLLPVSWQITLESIIHYIKTLLFERKYLRMWRKRAEAVWVMCYSIFQVLLLYRQDLRKAMFAIIRRFEKMPDYVLDSMQRLKEPCKPLLDIDIETITRIPAYFHSVKEIADEKLSPKKRKELARVFRRAGEALDKLTDWLVITVLPRCKNYIPVEPDVYQKYLKIQGADLSLDELLADAQEEIRLLKAKLKKLASRIKEGAMVEEIRERAREQYCQNIPAIIKYLKGSLLTTKKFVKKSFLPGLSEDDKIEMMETPVFMRAVVPDINYIPPRIFSKEEPQTGFILITPPETEEQKKFKEYNYYSLANKILSLIYPGYHTQYIWPHRHASLVKNIIRNPAIINGWAYYSQNRLQEMGLVSLDIEKFGHMLASMIFPLRVIFDIKLNTGMATEQEISSMLISNLGVSEETASSEIRMLYTQPGYYALGIYGRDMIRNLKKLYREKLGSDYKEERFHEEILSCEQLPFMFIEKELLQTK